jgi:hypothetical protein
MSAAQRRCLPTFADLIDEVTINQIKQVLLPDGGARHRARMAMLEHDIDAILDERRPPLSARLLRVVVALAQMNLHVWMLKERAQQDEAGYMEHLKLAHQLNGIRNQMKNTLLAMLGEDDPALRKSNCDVDGLAGWDVVLE